MSLSSLLGSSLRAGLSGPKRPDYKDPFDQRWLGRRITPTQEELWPIIRDTRGVKAAIIGGKGAAKTTTAAAMLIDRAQIYPGSKSFIAAATYQQAIESCAYQVTKVAKMMGVNFFYREKKIIDDLVHKHVYYFPDYHSNICIRSADNMDMIEGSEWDAGVIEEIQLWKPKDVKVALARLRRGVGDHARMCVGLPEDEEYWMYKFFEENNFELREVATRENEANLDPEYIPNLLTMYPGAEGERYISGKRVSLHSLPVQHRYRSEIHRSGPIPKKLTVYDPYRPLFISFDFNVAPMSVSLYQVKPYQFDVIREVDGVLQEVKEIKDIICQVDEFEGWRIGTSGTCDLILEHYGNHQAGGVVVGDASGNAEDTRSVSTTDWTIIAEKLGGMKNMRIKRGLIVNRGTRSGKRGRGKDRAAAKMARYSNPPLKDSINNFNRVLLDPDGHPGIVFLPDSRYESGGVGASVGGVRYTADGRVDESQDRQNGRSIKRTHFWATARYLVWFLKPPGQDYVTQNTNRNKRVIDRLTLG